MSNGIQWLEVLCFPEPAPFALLIAFAPESEGRLAPVTSRQGCGFAAYSAALADRSGQQIEQLEFYVESPASLATSALFRAGFVFQEARDSLWRSILQRLSLESGSVRRLGWEQKAPPVWVIDLDRKVIVPLIHRKSGERIVRGGDETGNAFDLSQTAANTGALLRSQLNPHQRFSDEALLPGTEESRNFGPEGNPNGSWQLFLSDGGRAIARRRPALSLSDYCDALQKYFRSTDVAIKWDAPSLDGSYAVTDFLITAPRSSQHWFLLLRLWRDMLSVVLNAFRQEHAPSLAIQPSTVRVDLNSRGGAPWPWTAQPIFDPLVASVKIHSDELYLPMDFQGEWAAAALNSERITFGQGVLVLTKLFELEGNSARLEGTFTRVQAGGKTFPKGKYFIVVRIALPGATIDIIREVSTEVPTAILQIDQRVTLGGSVPRSWLQARIGQKISTCTYTIVAPLGYCAELRALGHLGLLLFSGKDEAAVDALAEHLQGAFSGIQGPLDVEVIRETLLSDDVASANLIPEKLFSAWSTAGIPAEHLWGALAAFTVLLRTESLVGKSRQEIQAQLISAHEIGDVLVQRAAEQLFPGVDSDSVIARALSGYGEI